MRKRNGIAAILSVCLLSACMVQSADPKSFTSLDDGMFMIAFSNILDSGSRLAVYNHAGEELETHFFPTFDIGVSNESSNYYSFLGHRSNQHAKIDKQTGELTTLNHPEDLEEEGGAYFMHSEEGFSFYDINVGGTEASDGKYMSYLVFWEDEEESEKQYTELEGTIQAAHIYQDKIYAFSEDVFDAGHWLNVINSETGILEEVIDLAFDENMYPAIDDEANVLIGNTVYLTVTDNVDSVKNAQFLSVNLDTKEVQIEHEFVDSFNPIGIYVYDEQFYVLSSDGDVTVFSNKLELENKFTLSGFQSMSGYMIADMIFHNETIQILYQLVDSGNKYQGTLVSYDLFTGSVIESNEITHNKDFELGKLLFFTN